MRRLHPVRWLGGTKRGMLLSSDLVQLVSLVSFPLFSSCRVCSASSPTCPVLSFPIYTGYCGLHFADCSGKLPRSVLHPLPICLFSSWRLEVHPTRLLVEPLIRIG